MMQLLDIPEAKNFTKGETMSDWMKLAAEMVLLVAQEKEYFTSDDVWESGLDKPAEPRSLGVVMRRLRLQNLITPTGEYTKTTQKSRHEAPIQIWRRG